MSGNLMFVLMLAEKTIPALGHRSHTTSIMGVFGGSGM